MITVLRSTLQSVGSYFKRAPQHTEAVFGIIERMLWKENKHVIRLGGFEVLLLLLDQLDNPTEAQNQMVVTSLNVIPFTIDYVGMTMRHSVSSGADRSCIFRFSSPGTDASQLPTRTAASFLPLRFLQSRYTACSRRILIADAPQESLEVIAFLLDFVTKRPTTFDYWFRILKTYIFPLFYPSKCREVGLLDPADRALLSFRLPSSLIYTQIVSKAIPHPHAESGFHPTTPSCIQITLIDRVELWNATDGIINVTWSSPQHISLMMEIYRHALASLTIGHSDELLKRPFNDVIRKLIRSYQCIFMVRTHPCRRKHNANACT